MDSFSFSGLIGAKFCGEEGESILMENLKYKKGKGGKLLTNTNKLSYSVITVLDAVILGLPWIVYVKNRFKQEVQGWIDSIGWVYGIITGFVLVLYQFIL